MQPLGALGHEPDLLDGDRLFLLEGSQAQDLDVLAIAQADLGAQELRLAQFFFFSLLVLFGFQIVDDHDGWRIPILDQSGQGNDPGLGSKLGGNLNAHDGIGAPFALPDELGTIGKPYLHRELAGVRLGLLGDEHHLAFGSLVLVGSNEGGLVKLKPPGQVRRRETQGIDLIFQVDHVSDDGAGADRLPLLHEDAPQTAGDGSFERIQP